MSSIDRSSSPAGAPRPFVAAMNDPRFGNSTADRDAWIAAVAAAAADVVQNWQGYGLGENPSDAQLNHAVWTAAHTTDAADDHNEAVA